MDAEAISGVGQFQFPPPKVQFFVLVWLSFACAEDNALPNAELSAPAQFACKIGPSNNHTQILWNTRRCCDSCPPGTHMSKPCDPGDPSTTECSPCDPNTFTKHPNLLDDCFPQYPCLEQFGQKTEKEGTATNNFECSCMDGYEEMADGHCRRIRIPDKHQAKTTRFHDPPQAGVSDMMHTAKPSFTTPFTTFTKFTTKQLLTDQKQPVLIGKVTSINKNDLVKGTTAGLLFKPPETKATSSNDGSASITHIVMIVVPCSIVGIVAIVAIAIAIAAIASKRSKVQHYNRVHVNAEGGKNIKNAYRTDEPHPDNDSTTSFISASSDNGDHREPALDTVSTSTALGVMEINESITTLDNPGEPAGLPETGKPKSLTSLNDIESALLQPNNISTQRSASDN